MKILKIVDTKRYKPRLIDKLIEEYLQVAKAVCIEGPKWCGKTWASSFHSESEFLVGSPEKNFQNRKMAEMDPVGILKGNHPRLVDEWQEVPSLWDAVRMEADRSDKRGLFVLTGSSTPANKGIMHSGAGRIISLKMQTMSLFESGDSTGKVSLDSICKNTFDDCIIDRDIQLKDIAYLICRGGWPDNLDAKNITLMPQKYLESVVNYDIQRLEKSEKYNIQKVKLLLKSLARNESTTASMNAILNDISAVDNKRISSETLIKYYNSLSRLFLIENQEPFSPNIRSSLRVKQQEKRHFCDPALVCAALNLTPEKLMNDLNTFGFMFEALVERDLRIYSSVNNAKLFHYQDYRNNEIDSVIELPDGSWCAFEIKLGANQIDSAAENLLRVKEVIENNGGHGPSSLCVICGLSKMAYKREDGVYVVPITSLRN